MRINNIQGEYKYTERCKHINTMESFHAADHNGFANYAKVKILCRLKSKLYKNENPLEAGAKANFVFSEILWGEKSNFKNSEILWQVGRKIKL